MGQAQRTPPRPQRSPFSGRFSTKSRAYSTTLGALRADRAAGLSRAGDLLPSRGPTA